MTTAGIVAELPSLAAEITAGPFSIEPLAVPLYEVEAAWTRPTRPVTRLVFVP